MSVRKYSFALVLAFLGAATAAQAADKPTDPQIAHIAYTAGTIDVAAAKQAIATSRNKVVVSFAAANRDESVYPSPDTFDIDRYAVRPPPRAHLAFGHGPHVCLGANLARVQMTAIFTEVLSRTSWIEAAGEPALLRSNFQRGVKRLPIRWAA